MVNYGDYAPMAFDPAASGSPGIYGEYIQANQPLVSYQDNNGFETNGLYENDPNAMLNDLTGDKERSLDWNPINLAKLYPKLYLSPSGSFSNSPYKSNEAQQKNIEKLPAKNVDDFMNMNFGSYTLPNYIGNKASEQSRANNDVWKSLFKLMAASKNNETDTTNINMQPEYTSLNQRNCQSNNDELKWATYNEATKSDHTGSNAQQNISAMQIPSVNLESERLPLPERLVKKKTAQMKALQNLSKLKAMIHIAKEDRRTVQHKREEARRQFLSEVAEELQLMSSAKLAEIEASKSYRALSAAERALADKDRDIHMLLEKEDTLYEDLTDAEASLAKADMNFIPKIKSEDELRQFASFLNFGF